MTDPQAFLATTRDALISDDAGLFAPTIQVYAGVAPGSRFATVAISASGGWLQINLDRDQAREVAAALQRCADLLRAPQESVEKEGR